MSTTTDIQLRDQLQDGVSGSVLSPDDVGYDAARAVYNGLIDRKPALIVRAESADDVVAALAVAREAGLEVSVRGGGHNVAGRAVTEGGVMIDLAEMKRVTVDPERRAATAGACAGSPGSRRAARPSTRRKARCPQSSSS